MAVSTIPRTIESVTTGWGTTLTIRPHNNQTLVLINRKIIMLVWLASTSDIGILCVSSAGTIEKNSTTGTLTTTASETAIALTLTRSGNSFTVTTESSVSMTALI